MGFNGLDLFPKGVQPIRKDPSGQVTSRVGEIRKREPRLVVDLGTTSEFESSIEGRTKMGHKLGRDLVGGPNLYYNSSPQFHDPSIHGVVGLQISQRQMIEGILVRESIWTTESSLTWDPRVIWSSESTDELKFEPDEVNGLDEAI